MSIDFISNVVLDNYSNLDNYSKKMDKKPIAQRADDVFRSSCELTEHIETIIEYENAPLNYIMEIENVLDKIDNEIESELSGIEKKLESISARLFPKRKAELETVKHYFKDAKPSSDLLKPTNKQLHHKAKKSILNALKKRSLFDDLEGKTKDASFQEFLAKSDELRIPCREKAEKVRVQEVLANSDKLRDIPFRGSMENVRLLRLFENLPKDVSHVLHKAFLCRNLIINNEADVKLFDAALLKYMASKENSGIYLKYIPDNIPILKENKLVVLKEKLAKLNSQREIKETEKKASEIIKAAAAKLPERMIGKASETVTSKVTKAKPPLKETKVDDLNTLIALAKNLNLIL